MSRDRSNTISRDRERLTPPSDRIAARREVAPTFGDGFPRVSGNEARPPRPLASLSTDEVEPTPLFPIERSLSETAPPIDPEELRKFRAVPADGTRGEGAFSNTAASAPVPARTKPREQPRETRPSNEETQLPLAVRDRDGQSGFAVTQITPRAPRDVREGAAEQRLSHQNPEVARLADALRADHGALAEAYAETRITHPERRDDDDAARHVESSTERWLRSMDEANDREPPVAEPLARATPANPLLTAPPTPAPNDPNAETLALPDRDAVTRATGLEQTAVPPAPRSRTGDDVLEVALDDLCGRNVTVAHPPALPPVPRASVARPTPSPPPQLDVTPTPARPFAVAPTRPDHRELIQRLALQDDPNDATVVAGSEVASAGELDAMGALRRVADIPPLAWVGGLSFIALLVWLFTM